MTNATRPRPALTSWLAAGLAACALAQATAASRPAPHAVDKAAAVQARAADARFVGNWRLVSFENFDDTGVATPSRYTGGRIMYDAAGQMAAQLTFAERPALKSPSTEAERAAAYAGYVAYYGAYEIDPAASKVTHHVEGSTNPNWPNTDLVRYFEFVDDNTLKLSIRNAAGRITGTLVWARIR